MIKREDVKTVRKKSIGLVRVMLSSYLGGKLAKSRENTSLGRRHDI